MQRKYYETGLILTCGVSKWYIGEHFCQNPLGFCGKRAFATLARSGGEVVTDQSDQNGGIQGGQKVLQNRTHINMLALQRGLLESLFVKIQWVLLIKQQSQHWPNRGGFAGDRNKGIQGAQKVL